MLITNVIIGVAIGVVLAVLIFAWRARYRDVFGVILVLGVVAFAAAVTAYRVQEYDQHKTLYRAEAAPYEARGAYTQAPASGSSQPPAAIPRGPLPMGGATGAAAPEAARNPHLGAGK